MIRLYVYQRTNTVLNDSLLIVYRPVILYRTLNSSMDVIIVGDKLHNLRICYGAGRCFQHFKLVMIRILFYTVFLEEPPTSVDSYNKLGIQVTYFEQDPHRILTT